jgi:hypothetical protein
MEGSQKYEVFARYSSVNKLKYAAYVFLIQAVDPPSVHPLKKEKLPQ